MTCITGTAPRIFSTRMAIVVYFSTHQSPLYPGTGASTELGAGAGLGATINVPLPEGSGWSVFDPIFRQVLWPVADRLKPDVVLLSAGFDAHWCDPLGGLMLCTADYLRPDSGGSRDCRPVL